MTKPNEAVNTTSESNTGEKHRDIRFAEMLFSNATLKADVVTSALIGPKVPPFAGD